MPHSPGRYYCVSEGRLVKVFAANNQMYAVIGGMAVPVEGLAWA